MRIALRWVKQQVGVTNAGWTPIVAPLDFDYVAVRCDASDLALRTDAADPSTEDTLGAHVSDGVIGSMVKHGGFGDEPRFPQGEVVCAVKSVAPTATVIVTWVL